MSVRLTNVVNIDILHMQFLRFIHGKCECSTFYNYWSKKLFCQHQNLVTLTRRETLRGDDFYVSMF